MSPQAPLEIHLTLGGVYLLSLASAGFVLLAVVGFAWYVGRLVARSGMVVSGRGAGPSRSAYGRALAFEVLQTMNLLAISGKARQAALLAGYALEHLAAEPWPVEVETSGDTCDRLLRKAIEAAK